MGNLTVTCAPTAIVKSKRAECDGVTIILDRAMPMSVSANGTIEIDTTAEGCEIVAFDPPSVEITDGTLGDLWAHGAMQDPANLASQGFDELAAANTISVAPFPYSGALNVDPGANADAPIVIAQGEKTTIIKSVRRAGYTGTSHISSPHTCIDVYVPFAFNTGPSFGATRSGVAGSTKTHFGSPDTDVLRSLAVPSSAQSLLTAALSTDYMARTYPFIDKGSNAELLRRLQSDIKGDYSTDFGPTRGAAMLALHSDASTATKLPYFYRAVQHGVDIDSSIEGGFAGYAGAGQSWGYHLFHFLAAFALNSAPMLARAQALYSNAVSQAVYAETERVGMYTGWPFQPGDSNEERYKQTVMTEHVGEPIFYADGALPGSDYPMVKLDSGPLPRYATQNVVALLMELLPIMLLQNGPSGIDGVDAILGCPYGDASLDYADKVASFLPTSYTGITTSTAQNDLWASWRAVLSRPIWAGRPTQLVGGHFTAAASSVNWSFLSVNFATEAVTSRDLGISLDKRQWIDSIGVATGADLRGTASTGTISSLIAGAKHYGRVRQVSASGAGTWSNNGETSTYGGGAVEINTFTPTGTPSAAAPVNTVAPKVVYKPYPGWKAPWYDDCPATVPTGTGKLYAGVGYWTGYPLTYPSSFLFKWQDAGVDIGGATSSEFDFGSLSAGTHTIRVGVAGTNASGTSAYTFSSAVTVTVGQTSGVHIPSGTLGALPTSWTSRWNNTSYVFTLSDGNTTTGSNYASDCLLLTGGGSTGGSTGAGAAPPTGGGAVAGDVLFWSIDTLSPIGSLSSVAEGDMVLIGDYTGANNYTQANGIVIRASGASAAIANGYYIELRMLTSTTAEIRVRKISTGLALATLTSGSATVSTSQFGAHMRLRANWSMSGGTLTIKAKAWYEPTAEVILGSAEPAAWDVTCTDASPHAAGWIGVGNLQSRASRLIHNLAISTNPAVPASLV